MNLAKHIIRPSILPSQPAAPLLRLTCQKFSESRMRLIPPKKHDVQNAGPKSGAAEARARLRTESSAGHNLGLNQWKISRLGAIRIKG